MKRPTNESAHVLQKLDRIRVSHRRAYTINVLGRSIHVFPTVHSPEYFSDVPWFVKKVPQVVRRRSFLEIGTGTGVIALAVLRGGSAKIVATDINPRAVKNARLNFKAHGVEIDTRCGDVFAPIAPGERFDVIFWNHPFFSGVQSSGDMLTRTVFDPNYRGLRKFFRDARDHLNKDGELLLGTGTSANMREILKLARSCGYSSKLLRRGSVRSEHRKGVMLESRLYLFKAKQ